jgi:hypothetical protein
LVDLEKRGYLIGLLQGMFEAGTSNAQRLSAFTDVRDLERQLKAQGVALQNEADEGTTGPASFIAVDSGFGRLGESQGAGAANATGNSGNKGRFCLRDLPRSSPSFQI